MWQNRCFVLSRRNGTSFITLSTLTGTTIPVGQYKVTLYGPTITFTVGSTVLMQYTDTAPDYLQYGTVGFYGWYDGSTTYDNLLVQSVTLWSDSVPMQGALKRLGATSINGVELGSWAMIGVVGAVAGKVPVVSDLEVQSRNGERRVADFGPWMVHTQFTWIAWGVCCCRTAPCPCHRCLIATNKRAHSLNTWPTTRSSPSSSVFTALRGLQGFTSPTALLTTPSRSTPTPASSTCPTRLR